MIKKLAIGVGMFVASQAANALTYTVEISEAELQEKIEKLMPIEKKKFLVTVTLSDPDVDLTVGEYQIGLFSNVHVHAPGGVKGKGEVKIVGALRYDAENGQFFFDNPKIEQLSSENIPPKVLPTVKELAQLSVSKYLETKPVYKLSDEKLKHKLAKAMLQSVKVEDNHLLLKLSVL